MEMITARWRRRGREIIIDWVEVGFLLTQRRYGIGKRKRRGGDSSGSTVDIKKGRHSGKFE